MIEVRELSKQYGDVTAVDGVTFKAESGQITGFLGPNGAGKTTTMRMLTCFLPPSSGTATVDGFDTAEASLEVRRRIGYLPELPPLYHDMTVESYLDFVAKIKGVPSPQLRSRLDETMEKTGITHVARTVIGQLSKGYKQRVGLAQALVHNPPVLILDEPTVGLDPKQIHEVRELVKEWSGKHTVILSTHILPEVEQTCNRVVIVDRGKIVAVDTPSNLVHQLKGTERIVVDVLGPVEEVTSRIAAMPGVLGTHALESTVGRQRIQVESGLAEDLRPDLAEMIVQSGWKLFEMQSSKMSLEDIFLKLTTSDDGDEGTDEGDDDEEGRTPLFID